MPEEQFGAQTLLGFCDFFNAAAAVHYIHASLLQLRLELSTNVLDITVGFK